MNRIEYIRDNWKQILHLFFRTKRFGVNNNWWSDIKSVFGLPVWKQIVSVVLILPLIYNYYRIKSRIEFCHFIPDEEKKLFGFKSRH